MRNEPMKNEKCMRRKVSEWRMYGQMDKGAEMRNILVISDIDINMTHFMRNRCENLYSIHRRVALIIESTELLYCVYY